MIEASVWTEKLDLAGMFAMGRSLVARAAAWRRADTAPVTVRYACGIMLAAALVLGAESGAYAVVVTDDFSDGTDGAAAILAPPANNPAPASPPNVTGPIWTHLNGELVSADQTWDATTGELRMKAPDNGYIADQFGNQYGFVGSYVSTNYNDFSASINLVEPTGSPAAVATGYLSGLTVRGTSDNTLGGWSGYLFGYNQSLNGVPLRIEITKVKVGASTGVVASAPVALDLANKDYTLKLTSVGGSLFIGQVFEVGSSTALATAIGFDDNAKGVPFYGSGYNGLFGLSATPYGDVDATFDNFRSEDIATGGYGDFNASGQVDAGDFVLWRKLNGPAGTYNNVWRTNYGNPPGSGSGLGNGGSVPEPTSAVLVFLALVRLCFSRRGRSQLSRT